MKAEFIEITVTAYFSKPVTCTCSFSVFVLFNSTLAHQLWLFFSAAYAKHSSSRSTSRLRWPPETEGSYGNRRRNEGMYIVERHGFILHINHNRTESNEFVIILENQDMDISPGDSTPTSEASYSHSSTPTTQQPNHDGPVLLSNVLPRLACHPSTPTNSQLHFTQSSVSGISLTSTCTVSSNAGGNSNIGGIGGNNNASGGSNSSNTTNSGNTLTKVSISSKSAADACNSIHSSNLPTSSPSSSLTHTGNGGSVSTSTHSASSLANIGGAHNTVTSSELLMNSNAPGPPIPVTLANLPKILSQITGNKQIDQTELNPQKALQTINNALLLSSRGGAGTGIGQQSATDNSNQIANNNSNNLRDHVLNSPLYNYSHNMQQPVSIYNHTGNSQYVTSTAGVISTQTTGVGKGISMQFSAAGLKADGSSTLNRGDGPPTPTQELDMSCDHRKCMCLSISWYQYIATCNQVSDIDLAINIHCFLTIVYSGRHIGVIELPSSTVTGDAKPGS